MRPTRQAVIDASELMARFAVETGVNSDAPQRRYLWTDAFAVCTFLGLARASADGRYTDLALSLVDQVHQVLGTHRMDGSRSGWLSGLDEVAGASHPTRGGLRIGKPLPERAPSEPLDERLEWDRDGQYFHYLTQWMHALDRVSQETGQPRFNTWARELAEVAHRAFTYTRQGHRRMFWKMSTDLSRPLVPSMGHHDPLDGFITCIQLQATELALSNTPSRPSLGRAAADYASMIEDQDWTTDDPLSLGGLLIDASRIAQLMQCGAPGGTELIKSLLAGAQQGLSEFVRRNELARPARQRLAFRELGLAIGLSAIDLVEEVSQSTRGLKPYAGLGEAITSFWLDPEHRQTPGWSEHQDINDVMLATSLVPSGVLIMRE